MERMMRVTLRLGNRTRRVVLTHSPFPKKGDAVTISGEGAEWTVHKVEPERGFVINGAQSASRQSAASGKQRMENGHVE